MNNLIAFKLNEFMHDLFGCTSHNLYDTIIKRKKKINDLSTLCTNNALYAKTDNYLEKLYSNAKIQIKDKKKFVEDMSFHIMQELSNSTDIVGTAVIYIPWLNRAINDKI